MHTRRVIYETKSIFKISLHAVCPTTAFDSLAPSLTLALMRCPYDAVGGLPRLVIVERCTALAVVASCVVSAHTLAMDLPGKHHRKEIVWSFTVSVSTFKLLVECVFQLLRGHYLEKSEQVGSKYCNILYIVFYCAV